MVVVLGPLCVSVDASYRDVDAGSDGSGGEDEPGGEGNAGAGDICVVEPARGRRGWYLSGRPCRHCRLESRVLGHGLEGGSR